MLLGGEELTESFHCARMEIGEGMGMCLQMKMCFSQKELHNKSDFLISIAV